MKQQQVPGFNQYGHSLLPTQFDRLTQGNSKVDRFLQFSGGGLTAEDMPRGYENPDQYRLFSLFPWFGSLAASMQYSVELLCGQYFMKKPLVDSSMVGAPRDWEQYVYSKGAEYTSYLSVVEIELKLVADCVRPDHERRTLCAENALATAEFFTWLALQDYGSVVEMFGERPVVIGGCDAATFTGYSGPQRHLFPIIRRGEMNTREFILDGHFSNEEVGKGYFIPVLRSVHPIACT